MLAITPSPSRLEAVIFDWAGTLVDFGSFAPTQVFVEAFAQFGMTVTLAQARGPMGMGKRDHIRTLCNVPAIVEQYIKRFDHAPSDDDVTTIYDYFLPMQLEKVAQYSAPIEGAIATLAHARGRGMKLGSCSGYPASVMQRVRAGAAAQGLNVDYCIASDEVPRARPWPAMALQNVVHLGISDVAACVKVDDTAPGIEEGRRAGMWTVGLLLSGNAAGLTHAQYQAQDEQQRQAARARADTELAAARPHYTIDTIADLPAVFDDIDQRLARGQMPQSR